MPRKTSRRRGASTRVPGLSFSPKRAFGVTRAKRKIARATGIPTTRAGRQRKFGRMMGGCLLPILFALGFIVMMLYVLL